MTSPEKLAEKVEDFADDLGDNIEEGLHEGMERTEFKTESNIRENNSVVNESLINSINLDADTIDEFFASRSVRINAGHAPFVEYGTGMRQDGGPLKFPAPSPRPPLGPIKQWLIRKGMPTVYNTDLDMYPSDVSGPAPRIEKTFQERLHDLAYAIAEIIGKYGNRPHPFARPAARSGFDVTTDTVKRKMHKSVIRF